MPRGKLTVAITLCLASALLAITAAHATTLTVVNDTDDYVTVSVDGAYGCNTAGHTKCTIQVSPGTHALRAQKADGYSTSTTGEIAGDGAVWTISPEANPCSARARASEARIAAWNQKCVGASNIKNPSLYQWCDQERRDMRADQQRILNECPH